MTHPQSITTGPPVCKPKLITSDKEVITAIEEKQNEKDMKAVKPFVSFSEVRRDKAAEEENKSDLLEIVAEVDCVKMLGSICLRESYGRSGR